VERFIQTLQQECLDYFVVFGERHMDHLVTEMVTHYHEERPHQAKENSPLIALAVNCRPADESKVQDGASDEAFKGAIKCRERLGGRLRHYYRHAA
jgi:hypothetical protein